MKALSPGINDPTTATMCIDRLADIVLTFAQLPSPTLWKVSGDGTLRVLRSTPTFDQLIAVAFRQVRHYGAGDVVVAEHLAVTLGRVAQRVPATLRTPLILEAQVLIEEVAASISVVADVVRVESAAAWAWPTPTP